MKIKHKLSLLFSGLLLVSVTAIAYVALMWASANEGRNALHSVKASLALSAERLHAELVATEQLLGWLAESGLFDGMQAERFLPALRQHLARNPDRFEKFIVGLPDGSFYNTSGGNPHLGGRRSLDDADPDAPLHRITQRDYWRNTVAENTSGEPRLFVSQPMISYTTGVRQVVVARTLLDREGKVQGLLGASIEWDSIEQFIQQVQKDHFSDYPWPVRMLVTDRDGNYWYHWNSSKVVRRMLDENGQPVTGNLGQTLSLISNLNEENVPELANIVQGQPGAGAQVTPFRLPQNDENYFLLHQTIPDSGYMLGVVVSERELQSPVHELKVNYFWLLLAVLAIGSIAALIMARHIARPIEALTQGVKAMSDGKPLPATSSWGLQEVMDLAQAFDSMHNTVIEREKALAKSESRLNYALEGANDGLWDWDLNTNAVFYSPRWFSMLGRNPEDHPHNVDTFIALLHPEDAARANRAIESYLKGTAPSYRINLRLQHADGHYVHVLSRAFAVRDAAGTPLRLVGTHVDISEQVAFEDKIQQLNDSLEKRVQDRTADLLAAKEAALDAQAEAEQSSLAKSRFLANMSHELRTPLNAINGFADRLVEKLASQLEPRHRDALMTISRNGKLLLAMINDILDTQRIDSGEARLSHSLIVIPEMLDKLAREHQQERKPGVSFHYNCDPDIEQRTLNADPARLRQILSNLLSNAFKFTQEGEVTLEARAESRRGRRGMRFEVSDTGPGIPAGQVDNLFNAFTQMDDSLSRAAQGTGLGLALVKRLTELHHGQVSVNLARERGCQFVVWIPDRDATRPT